MESKIRHGIILFLEIAGMMILYGILDTDGIGKYLIAVVLTIFLFLLYRCNWRIIYDVWCLMIPVAVYCILGLGLSIYHGNFSEWTFKTLGFWTLPPVLALTLCMAYEKRLEHLIDMQFYGSVLAYSYVGFEGVSNLTAFESPYAFVFGLFVLYYVYRYQWMRAVIAIVFMFLAHKRIAVLAVAICLLGMLLMKLLKYGKKWVMIGWSGMIAAVGLYLYSIFSGVFEIICKKFKINTSTRLGVYKQIAEVIPENYYLGEGIGSGNKMLSQILKPEKYERWFQNPHNDFLKTYIEVGAIGLALFLISYFAVFWIAGRKINKQIFVQLFIMIIYFMILMTTDNVSIYILFLVPLYSMCYTLMKEEIVG